MEQQPRKRQAADIIALLAGVGAIGVAVWGVPLFGDRGDRAGDTKWSFSLVSGGLTLLAVFLTTKRQSAARWVLRLAGVIMLVSPFLGGRSEGSQLILSIVLGLMMLGSSFAFGDLAPSAPRR